MTEPPTQPKTTTTHRPMTDEEKQQLAADVQNVADEIHDLPDEPARIVQSADPAVQREIDGMQAAFLSSIQKHQTTTEQPEQPQPTSTRLTPARAPGGLSVPFMEAIAALQTGDGPHRDKAWATCLAEGAAEFRDIAAGMLLVAEREPSTLSRHMAIVFAQTYAVAGESLAAGLKAAQLADKEGEAVSSEVKSLPRDDASAEDDATQEAPRRVPPVRVLARSLLDIVAGHFAQAAEFKTSCGHSASSPFADIAYAEADAYTLAAQLLRETLSPDFRLTRQAKLGEVVQRLLSEGRRITLQKLDNGAYKAYATRMGTNYATATAEACTAAAALQEAEGNLKL